MIYSPILTEKNMKTNVKEKQIFDKIKYSIKVTQGNFYAIERLGIFYFQILLSYYNLDTFVFMDNSSHFIYLSIVHLLPLFGYSVWNCIPIVYSEVMGPFFFLNKSFSAKKWWRVCWGRSRPIPLNLKWLNLQDNRLQFYIANSGGNVFLGCKNIFMITRTWLTSLWKGWRSNPASSNSAWIWTLALALLAVEINVFRNLKRS